MFTMYESLLAVVIVVMQHISTSTNPNPNLNSKCVIINFNV